MRKLDLTGQRYGMLSVIHQENVRRTMAYWRCRCDCGEFTTVGIGNLRNGHTRSCGCARATTTTAMKTTHGLTGTPVYKSWAAMLVRCLTPTDHKFKDYGGRGIKVCKRWKKFENFYADMGDRPTGTTLGRINNDGHYKRRNCEWQTALAQGRNKRNNRRFRHKGFFGTIAQHCERLNLNPSTVRSRFYTYGWSISKSLSTKAN